MTVANELTRRIYWHLMTFGREPEVLVLTNDEHHGLAQELVEMDKYRPRTDAVYPKTFNGIRVRHEAQPNSPNGDET